MSLLTETQPQIQIPLEKIRRDGGTQLREKIDPETVAEYAEAIREGAVLPPIVLFQDEAGACWLADGFHRVAAAERNGRADIGAEVRQGSRRDAILFAAGTNGRHGLRRTNADKRRAALALLEDPEWRQFSDGEIGRRCAVSQPFVSSLRAELASTQDPTQNAYESAERIGADGRRINVSNIGRQAAEAEEPSWTPSENERRAEVEAGCAVLVNLHKGQDEALKAWAEAAGLLVRIDRGSVWGNPFEIGTHGTRAECCRRYAERFAGSSALQSQVEELRGKALACWCYPQQCHGETLLKALGQAEEAKPIAEKNADPAEPTAETPAEASIQEKAAGKMAIHTSSKSAEHYTPAEVIKAVLECFGEIDLDPCSNSKTDPNVPAALHYSAEDNGLLQPWAGRVFLNPPYGEQIGQWIERLAAEHQAGNVTEAIALVPARPGSLWFAELSKAAALWCFVSGRLTFIGNENPAHFPSALAYLGPRPRAFAAAFSGLGSLWREVQAAEVVDPAPKADPLAPKASILTGQDLAAWISKDKLSQRQAAELLGIGQASVSVWTRRTDEPLPAELNAKLARVLAAEVQAHG